MTTTVVADASVVAAALIETGVVGDWALDVIEHAGLVAPALVHVEVASVLRRAVLGGRLTPDSAALAHADLTQLNIELFGYEPFASRIWALHPTVTTYDAWYVAVAERFDLELVTLDRRLAAATGPTCRFRCRPSD